MMRSRCRCDVAINAEAVICLCNQRDGKPFGCIECGPDGCDAVGTVLNARQLREAVSA